MKSFREIPGPRIPMDKLDEIIGKVLEKLSERDGIAEEWGAEIARQLKKS